MPVRTVRSTGRNITGRAHAAPNAHETFESTLERDLLLLLRFDLNVDRFHTQPLSVPYTDKQGQPRHYTPDVLVTYRTDIAPANTMPTLLCEVKYTADLERNADEYTPKFRAATAYAQQRGWEFRVLDETHIRTPYLDNARFLYPYRQLTLEDDRKRLILEALFEQRQSTPEALLVSIYQAPDNRARLLPTLWALVSRLRIGADLSQPLTMHSPIWSITP
jgi:hypothetical protein